MDYRENWDSDKAARAVAGLGYPGFAYLREPARFTPAEVLLACRRSSNLEARVV